MLNELTPGWISYSDCGSYRDEETYVTFEIGLKVFCCNVMVGSLGAA